MYLKLLIVFISLVFPLGVTGQLFGQQPKSKCADCILPGTKNIRDTIMDIQFRDKTILPNCVSIKREMIEVNGTQKQALRLRYLQGKSCADTVVMAHQVEFITTGSLALDGNPFTVPILPAREFISSNTTAEIPSSYLELTGNLGYGGSDESNRKIGFGSIFYGGEVLVAPFGSLLGKKLSLALGGGLFLESGRMRFPVLAHLRYSLFGEARTESKYEFMPSPCQFGKSGDSPLQPNSDFKEVQTSSDVDSTVYYYRKLSVVQDKLRPFIYVEGGLIFNGKFDGSGANPSINPDDYNQFMLGGGVGFPFGNIFTASLGYRYMRLNLRTPCLTCPPQSTTNPDEYFVVNTNKVHSIILKLGLRFDW